MNVFLRRIVVAGAFAVLAGCNSSSSSSTPAVTGTPLVINPTASPTVAPLVSPSATPVAGSPIQNVVVVIMENRTYDNLFYGFPGGNFAVAGKDSKGNTIPLSPRSLADAYDPSHAYTALQTEWNKGAMNGFDQDPISPPTPTPAPNATPAPPVPYSFVPPNETTVYGLLASIYGLSDAMFASKQVPSFPGHMYLISGQGPSDNPTDPLVWGCDSKPGTTAPQFASDGRTQILPGAFPCYNVQTLGDLMTAKNVSWKYYTGAIGTLDGTISVYDAINQIRFGSDWSKVSTPETNILADIQNGNLPQVSYVTPPALASDHAGTFTAAGPGWVASIYLALAQSKYYGTTAMIVTWDDSGGWYDHVAPPIDNQGNPLGFRVPLIIESPFAVNAISHKQHDYGSILRFIEKNYGLGSLGTRDAQADDLSDMFNYTQKPIPPYQGISLASKYAKPKSYWDGLNAQAKLVGRAVDDDK